MKRALRRLGAAAVVSALAATVWAGAASATSYIVLYKQEATAPDFGTRVLSAGGTVVANYGEIGVVIVRSENPTFREQVMKDLRIEAVSATDGFGVALPDDSIQSHPGDEELPNAPATDADNFSPLQWDMRQISAPQAHAITGGSPSVLVGDLDTGLDKDHPDLIPNIDFSKSVSCESGAPDPNPQAWDDRSGHGTHTAGTIAAASNGIGIVGVAPNVRLAGVKTSNDAGFFFPEMVVCAFMWAGANHFDVTNNSYFADPFRFNCHNDPVQQAIWKAEYRAIRYAMTRGVTVVSSAGNENQDLQHPTGTDSTQPGNTKVGNQCVKIPAEVPGVITVTANGNKRQKSYYSSYGVSEVEVVAPGGDGVFQITPEAPNGLVLSTWPLEIGGSRSIFDNEPGYPTSKYRYIQGTSMASPHVAGVAALIISRYGDSRTPQNGKMRPGQVEQYLNQTADSIPCPEQDPFDPAVGSTRPELTGLFVARCQGGAGYNSFYGHGQVNALRAVTHDTNGR
jgi:lantibiotic leader peptide-processing serine protease